MTGFASVNRDFGAYALSLELRSVNSRFLDLVLKIPDELRAAEPLLREKLAGTLKRGKLECRISFQRRTAADRQPALDRGLLASLAQAARSVAEVVPDARPLSVADLLRWPGVWIEETIDPQAMVGNLGPMVDVALGEFVASRTREGRKLAQAILERVARIDEIVVALTARSPQLLKLHEERLTERLRAALADAAAGTAVPPEETYSRLRQEITLHGLRIDIAEELSRLGAHASEVRRVLDQGGAVGKRLDFLMQELNREANTVGSKTAAVETSSAAMDMKLLIEQMREQIQNLE
jgi:uncharacterized protein (TIGR00255 family)